MKKRFICGKEERKKRNVGIEKRGEKRVNTGTVYALLVPRMPFCF